MWPFPKTQPQVPVANQTQVQGLAARLLATALQLLDSTSSGRSTGSSSPSPRPLPPNYRIRGHSDVITVDRDRRVALQWEEARNQLPPHVRDPVPIPSAQLSSSKAVTGGFTTTTGASRSTDPPTPTAGSKP